MNDAIEYGARPWAIRQELRSTVAAYLRSVGAAGLTPKIDELREQVAALSPDGIDAPESGVEASVEAARGPLQVVGGLAVIPLRGVLTPGVSLLSLLTGGSGLYSFRAALRQAVAADEIGTILINVDSPGGVVDLIPETAAEIREAREQKRVVAIANTTAFSAAYWLASQADELVVTPSGEVGSVGVFVMHENWAGYNERVGVEPTYIHAGQYKVEANPDEPLSDDARAHIQAQVDEFYGMFVEDVARGRGTSAATVRADYGEGRTLTASRALDAGLVDRVETFDQTVSRLTRGSDRGRRALDATGDQTGLLVQMRDQLAQTTQSLQGGS